jgi:hypothetical protein
LNNQLGQRAFSKHWARPDLMWLSRLIPFVSFFNLDMQGLWKHLSFARLCQTKCWRTRADTQRRTAKAKANGHAAKLFGEQAAEGQTARWALASTVVRSAPSPREKRLLSMALFSHFKDTFQNRHQGEDCDTSYAA